MYKRNTYQRNTYQRLSSVLTLFIFVFMGVSCTSVKMRTFKAGNYQEKRLKKIKVYAVITTKDEYMKFSDENPAILFNGFVTGHVISGANENKDVKIPVADLKKIRAKGQDLGKTILGLSVTCATLVGVFIVGVIVH